MPHVAELHATPARRRLGQSDLHISAVGLGGWAIGGQQWLFGWGQQSDADSIATIHRAVGVGINWIDTAAAYGMGHSEEVIARALRDLSPASRPYVFTKCGLTWDDKGRMRHDLRPQSLRREAEASLRRLEVDCLDLYQIHWPVWPNSPPDHNPGSLDEAWYTLRALRSEGKVREIGVSNFNVAQLVRVAQISPPCSLQPPYSLVDREIEGAILPHCHEQRFGVIVYSPLQSGLLSGRVTRDRLKALRLDDWRRRSRFFREPALSRALDLAQQLHTVGFRHGWTAAQVAIAWTLLNETVTGAIVGAHRPEDVDEIAGVWSVRLGAEEVNELLQQALIDRDSQCAASLHQNSCESATSR